MLDLHFMPYTHSLAATFIWAIAAAILYAALRGGAGKWRAGAIIGAAVASHWILDFIVHGPDLALYFGGPKVGLGVWNSLPGTFAIEFGLLFIGAAIYLAHTRPKTAWGRYGPFALVGFMVLLQIYDKLPVDHPPSVPIFAVMAATSYTLMAVAAYFVDRARAPA